MFGLVGLKSALLVVESLRGRKNMKAFVNWPIRLTLAAVVTLIGCSRSANPPGVAANIRIALGEAGLKTVSVAEDRDKGVVTLGGHVAADAEKAQAEALAKSLSAGEVVADQIAVLPLGAESDARTMNSDLDKGIEQNLDAALIQNKLRDGVKYTVKSGVVTLTGDVDSQARRRDAARVAGAVPNVQQVVNELQVKKQKASSSE
jgi:hyperosmotically inducible periplasmic protein